MFLFVQKFAELLTEERKYGTKYCLWVAVYLNGKSATFFIFSNYQRITERMRYQK